MPPPPPVMRTAPWPWPSPAESWAGQPLTLEHGDAAVVARSSRGDRRPAWAFGGGGGPREGAGRPRAGYLASAGTQGRARRDGRRRSRQRALATRCLHALPRARPRPPQSRPAAPSSPFSGTSRRSTRRSGSPRPSRSDDALQEAQQVPHEEKTPGEACVELVYTVRRLVRGLASPRDGARQGFGAALIEVLCVFERQVTVESVLELMNNSMQLQGSMKGRRSATSSSAASSRARRSCARAGSSGCRRRGARRSRRRCAPSCSRARRRNHSCRRWRRRRSATRCASCRRPSSTTASARRSPRSSPARSPSGVRRRS